MKRFGQPDTSLKAFGRLLWDAFRHDFTMKILVAMAVLVPAYALWHDRVDVGLIMLAFYVVSLALHFLAWRRLVKKGVWWLM